MAKDRGMGFDDFYDRGMGPMPARASEHIAAVM